MTTPWVAVKLFKGLHRIGFQGIEMNIANQFQEVGLFFTKDRLVAVLEEVSYPAVPPIEIDRVSCHELAHEGG